MFWLLFALMLLLSINLRYIPQFLLVRLIIICAVVIIMNAESLGVDFENYNTAIEYYHLHQKLPDGWPQHELIFSSIIGLLASLDLDARAIGVLNCSLFFIGSLIKQKHGLIIDRIFILVFLPIAAFNGLRLGLGLACVYIILKSFKAKDIYFYLLLMLIAATTHASLLFPLLIYVVMDLLTKHAQGIKHPKKIAFIFLISAISVFILAVQELLIDKFNSYFLSENLIMTYGWIALAISDVLIFLIFYRANETNFIRINIVLVIILIFIANESYLGLRLLGLLPLICCLKLCCNRIVINKGVLYFNTGLLGYVLVTGKAFFMSTLSEYIY